MKESVHPVLGDQRRRVCNTKTPPYAAIARLQCTFNGQVFLGTGFLVCFESSYFVVTCAHNLYKRNLKKSASKVNIILGKDGKDNPIGTIVKGPGDFVIPREYIAGISGYDYGVILLDKDRDRFNTRVYFTIEDLSDESIADVNHSGLIRMSGYPGVPSHQNQEGVTPGVPRGTQWKTRLSHVSVEARRLQYQDATTPGNSGSPVFVKRNGQYIAFGIHIEGFDDYEYNTATRISTEVKREIINLVVKLKRETEKKRRQRERRLNRRQGRHVANSSRSRSTSSLTGGSIGSSDGPPVTGSPATVPSVRRRSVPPHPPVTTNTSDVSTATPPPASPSPASPSPASVSGSENTSICEKIKSILERLFRLICRFFCW